MQYVTNTINCVFSFRQRIIYKCKRFNENLQEKYEKYTNDGALHEFFYFGAFLCFALGVIILGNLLIEIKYGSFGWTRENNYWNSIFSHFMKYNMESEVNV